MRFGEIIPGYDSVVSLLVCERVEVRGRRTERIEA